MPKFPAPWAHPPCRNMPHPPARGRSPHARSPSTGVAGGADDVFTTCRTSDLAAVGGSLLEASLLEGSLLDGSHSPRWASLSTGLGPKGPGEQEEVPLLLQTPKRRPVIPLESGAGTQPSAPRPEAEETDEAYYSEPERLYMRRTSTRDHLAGASDLAQIHLAKSCFDFHANGNLSPPRTVPTSPAGGQPKVPVRGRATAPRSPEHPSFSRTVSTTSSPSRPPAASTTSSPSKPRKPAPGLSARVGEAVASATAVGADASPTAAHTALPPFPLAADSGGHRGWCRRLCSIVGWFLRCCCCCCCCSRWRWCWRRRKDPSKGLGPRRKDLDFATWLIDEVQSRPDEAQLPRVPKSHLEQVSLVPHRLEKLLALGFLLCLDILLHELSFTPLQAIFALPRALARLLRGRGSDRKVPVLTVTELGDLIRPRAVIDT